MELGVHRADGDRRASTRQRDIAGTLI